MFKKTVSKLGLALAAGALCLSAAASAVTVGGINFFDAIPGNPTPVLGTTTLAETYVDGNGQMLRGYGVISTVNGDSSYCGTGSGPGATACNLMFVFDGYESINFTGTSSDFTGGSVRIYRNDVDPTFNFQTQNSDLNFAYIESLTPWLTLSGSPFAGITLSADGTLLGAGLAFSGSGLLDVVSGLADVSAFLNTNTFAGADMELNSSGSTQVNNAFDTCTFVSGQWCIQGSADIRGVGVVPVPAPAVLGLMLVGLGLIGSSRKLRK
jgi:hypothetical protein